MWREGSKRFANYPSYWWTEKLGQEGGISLNFSKSFQRLRFGITSGIRQIVSSSFFSGTRSSKVDSLAKILHLPQCLRLSTIPWHCRKKSYLRIKRGQVIFEEIPQSGPLCAWRKRKPRNLFQETNVFSEISAPI